MAFSFSPKIVTDGLVLALDAANPRSYVSDSNVWNDLTANQVTGSLINGPTYNKDNGGSIVFDGVDDRCPTSYVNSTGANNTTQLVWVKWNGVNQLGVIMYLGNSASTGLGLLVNDGSSINIGNKVSVLYGGSFFNAIDTGTTFATLSASSWTQLTLTRDSTTTRLYQNQTFLGSTTRTPNSYLSSLNLNLLSTVGSALFGGQIANALFYNRSLSPTEVFQNYNALKGRFGLT